MARIDIRQYRRVVVLTGAGISAASGLRTYRGKDGLWNEMDPESFSTVEGLESDPLRVWRFYADVRDAVLAAQPNAAHLALAEVERRAAAAGATFTVITQNVDSLHTRAGSNDVIELHGNAVWTRCSNEHCSLKPFREERGHRDTAPKCALCGSILRPRVTFFGEALPAEAAWKSKRLLRDCDLFLAIGTSGTVSPASEFVRGADYAGARTLYVNLEPLEGGNRYFQETVLGPAERTVPELFGL